MPRQAKPRVWREWYVTEAGGKGIHKLCPAHEGIAKAKAELKKWEAQCLTEREAGISPASSVTVDVLAAEFVRLKQTTKKPSTAEFYRKNLRRLVGWYGHIDVQKLQYKHAVEYVTRMKTEGLSNDTISHHFNAAKSVLKFGVKTKRLLASPWDDTDELRLPKKKRKRIVTDEEFEKLLEACEGAIAYQGKVSRKDNVAMMKDLLRMLRQTALRPGELRILRWDHLHLDEGLIIIPAEEQKTGTTAKDPEDRWVPILDEAKAILLARKIKYGHQPLVFPNLLGTQWTEHQFSRRFARLRKRAGLEARDHHGERITPYSLRHTRLTEAGVREKWDFFSLMRFAGHTNPTMTKRYVHPGKDDLLRAAREGEMHRRQVQTTAVAV